MRRWLGIVTALAVVSACSDEPAPNPTTLDDTSDPDSGPTTPTLGAHGVSLAAVGAQEVVHGAVFEELGGEGAPTGSFPYQPFVRLDGGPVVEGYNTAGRPLQFDENDDAALTRDLPLNQVPVLLPGGDRTTAYREIRFEVDEPAEGDDRFVSVDRMWLYLATAGGMNDLFAGGEGASSPTGPGDAQWGELAWDLDGAGSAWVLVDGALESASGRGHVRVLVPESDVRGALEALGLDPHACPYDAGAGGDCGAYLVLYSTVGENAEQNGDFSQWAVQARPELTVVQDLEGSFEGAAEWSIEKSVDVDHWDLFVGDTGESSFEIEVTKTEAESSGFRLTGSVDVTNGSGDPVELHEIVSALQPDEGEAVDIPLDCGETFPHVLAGGETLTCSLSWPLAGEDPLAEPVEGVHHVDVFAADIITDSEDEFTVAGAEPVEWDEGQGLDAVTVHDDLLDETMEFTESGTWSYSHPFTCSQEDVGEEPVTVTNTATIQETEQTATSEVAVDCWALDVTKDVETTFEAAAAWQIEKTVDPAELELFQGEAAEVEYTVRVSQAGSVPVDATVTGGIDVANSAPVPALLAGVTDVVPPDVDADVLCEDDQGEVAFPYELPAETTLGCTYTAEVPEPEAGDNTATATLQNRAWTVEIVEDEPTLVGTPLEGETTDFVGTAEVVFEGEAEGDVDACVTVTDAFDGGEAEELGVVCLEDLVEGSFDFTYPRSFGSDPEDTESDLVLECGEASFTNVATFTGEDTGQTGSAEATVTVVVDCPEPCVRGMGYWKTHSAYGPAPHDETWSAIGEDTEFFASGLTYHETMWTPPVFGNAFHQLAPHWIATYLNMVAIGLEHRVLEPGDEVDLEALADLLEEFAPSDEDLGDVGAAWLEAMELLEEWSEKVDDLNSPSLDEETAEVAHRMRELKEILERFNEGEFEGFPDCESLEDEEGEEDEEDEEESGGG